jgi:hypothetical protein
LESTCETSATSSAVQPVASNTTPRLDAVGLALILCAAVCRAQLVKLVG